VQGAVPHDYTYYLNVGLLELYCVTATVWHGPDPMALLILSENTHIAPSAREPATDQNAVNVIPIVFTSAMVHIRKVD
jgi:hypothetical protein